MPFAVGKTRFSLVFILCALTFGVAQQSPPQRPQTGTILGTVLDVTGGTVPNLRGAPYISRAKTAL